MSFILVKVTSYMINKHLWNIIGLDDKELIPASHCYAKVVARWLEVLAGYTGQLNLMVITSRIEIIEGLVGCFEL